MTITYSLSVANARLTGFSRLLLRWKGSIYKLLYREMAIFCAAYYGLSGIYRYLLSDSQRTLFEKLSLYCEAFTHYIPLSFVLGFYVTLVVGRWWQQYLQIPWPDKCLILISGHVHGTDERGRMIRRTLARYLLLMQVFTCQAVSIAIFKRFPSLDHIEDAGFITPEEREVYESVPSDHGKWWVPAQWFSTLVIKARKEGRIKHDIFLYQILEELHILRSFCGMMFAYDWISIPLVYTQTVTIATYTYFLATLMGRQYLDPAKGYQGHEVDLYVPVFTVLEFFFFMGWLKVAEQLINGYGEDDDDFDLHWCLERNTVLSYHIVDSMYQNNPKMVKDKFWDDPKPVLPHTKSSLSFRRQPFLGSAMNLNLDPEEVEIVTMPPIDEEDGEQMYTSTPASPNLIDIEGSAGGGTGDDDDPPGSIGVRRTGSGVGAYRSDRGSAINNNASNDTGSSRNRFLPDFRPSRLINMRIGQSCDNVSKSSGRLGLTNEKGGFLSLFPPFLLETPPQKRNRTISLAESMNQNCINMHDMARGGDGTGDTESHRSVIGGYNHSIRSRGPGTLSDLPNGPSLLTNYRPSPIDSRKDSGTPGADVKSIKDDVESIPDSERGGFASTSSSRYRMSSISEPKDSFRFVNSFGPASAQSTGSGKPSERFFPSHLTFQGTPTDSPCDDSRSNIIDALSNMSPSSINGPSRRNSKVHSVAEEAEEDDDEVTIRVDLGDADDKLSNDSNNNNANNNINNITDIPDDVIISRTGSVNSGCSMIKEDKKKESSSASSSSNSSQDSFSPFASNEGTVTSITELLASEKKSD